MDLEHQLAQDKLQLDHMLISKVGQKKEWATDLSALLTGRALGVYARMAPGDAGDYEKVKEAILKRYQLTEEDFRTRFHESPPEVGESPGQFLYQDWKLLEEVDEVGQCTRDV